MAIAKMERLMLTFNVKHLDEVMHLMQGFQGVHIDTGFESTVPPARKAAIDLDIQEAEKKLQGIQSAYSVLKGRDPALFKGGEERVLSNEELIRLVEESDWEAILAEIIQTDRRLTDNRKKRQEVTQQLEVLALWEHLSCNPLDFAHFERTTALFGSVHQKHAEEFTDYLLLYEGDGLAFENVATRDNRIYFLLLCHASMDEKLRELMNQFSFTAEVYPFDLAQIETRWELEKEEKRLLAEEQEIDEELAEQAKYQEILQFAEDYNLNILMRKKKSLEVTYDGEDIIINGWLIAAQRQRFEQLFADNIPQADYRMLITEVKEKDIPDVPIKLQNNKVVTVYERLTEMYSMPRYNELDPTPVMTVFYLLFFGLMVADVGYGLAVFLIGLLVRKVLKVKRSTKNFVSFLYYLSFPMMGWGLVFGSFFGLDLPFGLIRATVDIVPLIILSVCLGFLHIMAGLVIHMVNQARLKNYGDMLTGGLAWFLVFLGGAAMIVGKMAFDIPILFLVGAVVLGVGLALVIVVPAIQYGKRWYLGLGKGLYALYGATSYLGDFVSYTRLMALGVAGGSVALAFNTILSFLPLPAKMTIGVVLAVGLHALNMFLSMLSAYVHGIRLQFIEFFGKFYEGGGKRFEPFKTAEKNVIIND